MAQLTASETDNWGGPKLAQFLQPWWTFMVRWQWMINNVWLLNIEERWADGIYQYIEYSIVFMNIYVQEKNNNALES